MSDPWSEYRVPDLRERRSGNPQRSAAEEFYDDLAETAMHREAVARQRQAIANLAPDPERKARARSLAREIGIPAPLIETDLPGYEQQQRMDQTARAARDDPRVGNWLADNAEIAGDDILGILMLRDAADGLTTLRDFSVEGALQRLGLGERDRTRPRQLPANDDPGLLESIGEAARALPGRIGGAGVYAAGAGLREFTDAISGVIDYARLPTDMAAQTIVDILGLPGAGGDPVERLTERQEARAAGREQMRETAQGYRDRNRSSVWALEQVLSGTEYVLPTAAAVLTRNPRIVAGIPAASVAGNEYREARDQGLNVASAISYGGRQAVVEYLTEKIPASQLVEIIAKRTPFAKALVRQLGSEIPGEQVATLLQDLNAWAMLPENRDKTIDEFVSERPTAALSTLLGTAGSTTAQVTIAKTVDRALRVVTREAQDRQRIAALEEVMDAAAENKVRERDTGAFANLLKQLAGEGQSIFVPATVVAEFNQSYHDHAFWGDYSGRIDEGLATGGDVEIPLSDAAARLAGTPEWEQIKDRVRPSPGGSSLAEIEEANAELESLRMEAGEQLDQEERQARQKAAPGDRLRETARTRLMNAGLTPEQAATNAEVVAALFETEAARMGRELTGGEFDAVMVQRELPGLLAASPADTLDLVVNAMRLGKDAEFGVGPSLLEFIKQRGGINDTGGDLASMGVPKKLIRDFDPKQAAFGGVSGQGDYGLDTTLRAAITEGYFPELLSAEGDGQVSQLDTQALLDAIAEEVAGRPRYAETREDQMRVAGEELRELLWSAGVDPDTASIEQIRAAVERFDGGQVYAQLPDTIEIDGVARPTRNSEGQPLAGSEKGVRAFWAWFGDSKVVDAEGRPLVVYHGTLDNIDQFDRSRLGENTQAESARAGFFFTSDPDVAASYGHYAATVRPVEKLVEEANAAEKRGDWDGYDAKLAEAETLEAELVEPDNRLRGQNVMPVYLRLAEPVELDAVGESFYGIEDDVHSAIKEARRSGDGAIFRNLDDAAGLANRDADHFLVFDPTQIKSINNRGTFDPADARILYQAAFHGSPHIFDKFSLSAIGTGEGAQAYGWGLYFAGKREVAEFYRAAFQPTMHELRTADGRVFAADTDVDKLIQAATTFSGATSWREVNTWLKSNPPTRGKSLGEVLTRTAELEQQGIIPAAPPRKGRLYEVEIPEDDEYLLWDKPLSEQPEGVREQFEWAWREAVLAIQQRRADEGIENPEAYAPAMPDNAGEAYRRLGQIMHSERAASMALKDLGIAGIKYLDGGSRVDGEGSYNYVVFDDSRVSIRAYEQRYNDGAQGQIQFTAIGAIIKLFETANASTFQHEMAHFWLERLKANALESVETDGNEAARQTFADWETIKAWFKAEGLEIADDGMIPTEAHEMFARGWERYLMEGKAPSTRLQGVFRKFARWLKAIYRTVADLRSPITPEIREVMDRMLATDEQISEAQAERNARLMFDDAVDAGMSEADARRYAALGEEIRSEAEEELYAKVFRSIRARERKQWREDERQVRARVTEAVNNRPVFRALNLLREKGGPRLDRNWLRDNFGEDVLKILPAGMPVYSDGGENADRIAEQAGLPSGDQLVRELIGLEQTRREMKEGGDKRSVKAATIDFEVSQEMHARFGDPFTDGTIEREASAAIQNERQGERLELELRALGSKTNRRPTPYAMARRWARERIQRGIVADSISGAAQHRYTRTAAKASRDAQAAFLKGDNEEAFRHKQTEMLHNALAREAAEANERVEKAVKRMGKLAGQRTVKSMDQEYLEQIHALLERVDFKRRSQASINRKGKWAEWAAEREAEGFDIILPAGYEAQIGKMNWSRMTVEELLTLDDGVKQIAHLGRLKQKLIDGKDARDFEEVVREAETSADDIGRKPPKDTFTEPSWWDSVKHRVATIDAALLKMEQVFDWLDQGNSNGVFNRIVFRPMADAQEREQDMTRDYFTRIREAMERVPSKTVKSWADKVTIDLLDPQTGTPATMTRQKLVAMALNWGNEGNRQRLADGYGWSQAGVERTLMGNLREEEWAFVQEVWDIVDSLWPEIAAMERRVNGVAPEKVEAVEVDTPFGKLRGGYYPAVYDTNLDRKAKAQAGLKEDLLEANYTRATTRASATKDRAEKVKRPILLDLGVINRHLGEVIHDVTHREAIMQAHRFLTNERVMRSVDETLGKEVTNQFRPWLKHIANSWAQERAGNEAVGQFMTKARANTTVVGMGFRITTMLTQAAGYSNSFEYVGSKWVASGIAQSATHPIETFRFVMERSGEMRNRMDTIDRDINLAMRKMRSKAGNLDAAKRFAFHGIGYMDRAVSIPTWMGAYNKALFGGASEDQAVYAADKAIRLSQGAAGPKDLAAVATGQGRYGVAFKLMTMFYTYLSTVYSRQRNLGRDTVRADAADLPGLIARAWWLVVVPPLLAEILSGRGPDEDEDWGLWAFKKMLGQSLGAIPVVRDLVDPIFVKVTGQGFAFNYRLSPVTAAGESLVRVGGDIGNIAQGEKTNRATRNTLEAIGYTTGLVPGQIAASTQFLVDVGYGEQDPQTAAEWWEGITKGRVAEK